MKGADLGDLSTQRLALMLRIALGGNMPQAAQAGAGWFDTEQLSSVFLEFGDLDPFRDWKERIAGADQQLAKQRIAKAISAWLAVREEDPPPGLALTSKQIALLLELAANAADARDLPLAALPELQGANGEKWRIEAETARSLRKEACRRLAQYLLDEPGASPGATPGQTVTKSPVDLLLEDADDLERAGRYFEALDRARSALDKASVGANEPNRTAALCKARATCSHLILLTKGSIEEAWEMADLAADPDALAMDPEGLVDALSTKSEAAVASRRLSIAKGCIAAVRQIALPTDERSERRLMQLEAQVALAEGDPERAARLYDDAAETFLADIQRGNARKRRQAKLGVAACLHNKGYALHKAANPAAACEALHKAVIWYREANSPVDEAVASYELARTHFDQQEWTAGFDTIEGALQLARDQSFTPGVIECLELLARARATTDDPAAAAVSLREALELADSANDAELQRRFRQMLATLEFTLGDAGRAQELLIEALALAHNSGDPLAIADVEHQMAHPEPGQRLDGPAQDIVIESLAREIRTTEIPSEAAYKSQQLAGAYRSRNEIDSALVWYGRALERATALSDHALAASAKVGLAEIAILQDDYGTAEALLDEASTLVLGHPALEVRASVSLYRGRVQALQGRLHEARVTLREGLTLAERGHHDDLVVGITETLERVDRNLTLFRPPSLSFDDLIEELERLESWYPERKPELRRLWWYWRQDEVLGNLRAHSGPKALFVTDDPDRLSQMTTGLSALFDVSSFVARTPFARNEGVFELVPFPSDWPLPEYVNQILVDSDGRPRAVIYSDEPDKVQELDDMQRLLTIEADD